MYKSSHKSCRLFAFVQILFLAASNLSVKANTNSPAGLGGGFVKTNSELASIGGNMVKTNSMRGTDYSKEFRWRAQEVFKVMNSGASNATDLFVDGAWALAKDYPNEANGFQDIMAAMGDYEFEGKSDKARTLANQFIASTAPEKYKTWAKGYLNRLDSRGRPMSMQFTAVDGREVDLSKMNGKVVLVDFWATTCGPCVKELPRVKAAYEKFHAQGFDVVGISCDTDKGQLARYVQDKGLPWPQYFDGKQQDDNKFTVRFGIDGIPHMFLVDKKGLLRFDNVRASDAVHPKGDTTSFEEKISKLLTEP